MDSTCKTCIFVKLNGTCGHEKYNEEIDKCPLLYLRKKAFYERNM